MNLTSIRLDQSTLSQFSPHEISQLDNEQLLRLVRCCEISPVNVEHDHRRYLPRQELERLVFLVQRMRRRPLSGSARE
jgi:hypothetical protein